MKAKFLSLAVITALCAGIAEARLYVGVEAGYTGGFVDTSKKLNSRNSSYLVFPGAGIIGDAFKDHTFYGNANTYEVEPWKGFNVALTLGSEHFFAKDYLGLRWGASVGYTEIQQDVRAIHNKGSNFATFTNAYVDAGLNLDAIVNFIATSRNSFGIFGGVGMDYHYLVTADVEEAPNLFSRLSEAPSRHSIELVGRVGLTTLLAKHHRIDVTAKLPFGYIAAGKNDKIQISGYEPLKTSFNVGYKYVF